MSKLYNDSVQVASEKIKWQRDDVAAKIVDFEQARHKVRTNPEKSNGSDEIQKIIIEELTVEGICGIY